MTRRLFPRRGYRQEFRTVILVLALFMGWVWPVMAQTTGSPLAGIPAEYPEAEEKWNDLLSRGPFPYSAPLPPEEKTAIDGTYAKVDPKEEAKVHCLRCPDYAPEGGPWRLQFDKGVYRIIHLVTGWKSMGSFRLEKDKLLLFNDPVCQEITGAYTWTLAGGQLNLKAVEDSCAIRLRAANLTKQPWLSCAAPNREAGISSHWPVPQGCRERP